MPTTKDADYKGEFVATGGRSEIRRLSELVPSKPLALHIKLRQLTEPPEGLAFCGKASRCRVLSQELIQRG